MNWTSVDPGAVEVGQYVRWVEGKFSPNYQDRFPASYLATVGQVMEITPKGLQLRIISSVGEAPLAVTDQGNKPTFRTKAKLSFCLFEVRGGKPEGTAHESAQGALAAWELRRTGGLEPHADDELDSRLSQGERSPLPAPPDAEIETSSQTEVQGSPEGNLQPQVMGRRLRTHSTVYIDAEVRSELANLLHLTNDPADGWLWRLTDHLAFGAWLDEDTGAILLDHRSLGAITARSHRSGSFSAYDFIQQYQRRTGARLTVSSPNALAGKARAVESLEFPTGVDELLRQARRTTCPISERVALDTGLPWSNNIRVQQRLFTREEALIRGADAINPDAIRLLRLLNEAPPNRWANFDDHLPNLREVAAGLDPKSREYALNVLARVEIQPKPFFKPVERTCRLYGIGTTLLSLPREVRKALVHAMGWRSLDLRQAQLAVVSRLWKVPRLEALIQSRTSFWAEMLTVLGLDHSYKPFVKNLLYALVFGEGEAKAKGRFNQQFGMDATRLWELWQGHPVIADLIEARSRMVKAYQSAGGAEDAYGRWWAIMGRTRINQDGNPYPGTNAINVLATVAQSYELKLLSPAIDIIEKADRRVQLTYWLHDGFCLSLPNNRDYVLDQIKEAVDAQAKRLGITTSLDDE